MVIKMVTKEKWFTLKSETSNTVLSILETVDVLINHVKGPNFVSGVTPIMCAGLFSHAVEEYGKLLYLKSLGSVKLVGDNSPCGSGHFAGF